jgi:hypothetical protein
MKTTQRRLLIAIHSRLKSFKTRVEIKKSDVWLFLNSAFFLWLLSTVVVGSAATVWAQRNECREQFARADQRFVKSLLEYRYRMGLYSEAAKYPVSSFAYFDYKSQTLADVTTDLEQSLSDLTIYSDIDSFEIGADFRLRRKETTLKEMTPPSTLQDIEQVRGQCAQLVASKEKWATPPLRASKSQKLGVPIRNSAQEAIASAYAGLKSQCESILGDPALDTLYTAATLDLAPRCGVQNVLEIMLSGGNTADHRQVSKLYALLVQQYQRRLQQQTNDFGVILEDYFDQLRWYESRYRDQRHAGKSGGETSGAASPRRHP